MFAFVLCAVALIIVMPKAAHSVFPQKYEAYVDKYCDRFGMDKFFILAVIKTESNFDPRAESDVGARGLMQIMNDAYEWVAFRMDDSRELTYDDMFDPETNIEYGTYLLMLLYDEYGDERTALAAYHAGRGCVNGWLSDSDYSSDGRKLDTIPSAATAHYVSKVMNTYDVYRVLYDK